jgi:hypothetical protein
MAVAVPGITSAGVGVDSKTCSLAIPHEQTSAAFLSETITYVPQMNSAPSQKPASYGIECMILSWKRRDSVTAPWGAGHRAGKSRGQ